MRLAGSENTHSRLVIWAKVTLPLLALALLATMFLFSRKIDPADAIPYAEVDVEERAREPRLTEPTYAGVTADGSALAIAATEARPESATGISTATAIVGRLDMPDGGSVDMVAANGVMDSEAGLMTMDGGVNITTTNGYTIITDALIARLDQTGLSSPGAITATGPVGRISADQMMLTQDPKTPGSYLLVFTGRVKVLHIPTE
jgi:lipopolysaccharide export system protein LptC